MDLRIALHRQAAQPLHTSNPGRIFENTIIMSLPAQGAQLRRHARPTSRRMTCAPARFSGSSTASRIPASSATTRGRRRPTRSHGGVHNWSESTVDEQRGIAFISFGSPRFDFYGGDRQGNNLFGNSLVALDARTGKRMWHYQLVHHDLWDYDLPQAPKLLTIRQNGRTIDVVAQATKHGFLFVFERETGRPIWPIEERPGAAVRRAGRADVADAAVPDQAGAVRAPDVHREGHQPVSAGGGAAGASSQRFKSLRNEGLFTPPSFEGSISDAGPQRRGELRDVRGRSHARRDVRRRQGAADGRFALTLPAQAGRRWRRRRWRWWREAAAGPIVTPEQKAQLIAQAKELLAQGATARGRVPRRRTSS